MDKALVESILSLKPVERMLLLNVIHASLDAPNGELDNIWYDEAERRLVAFKADNSRGIPASQVLGRQP